jgi:NhaA family Na+:H+ antiporter
MVRPFSSVAVASRGLRAELFMRDASSDRGPLSVKQAVASAGGMFEQFVRSEIAGSVVLVACTLAALLWANSPWSETYFDILHTKIGLSWGTSTFALSLHHWINDGLMVVFFFVVGLEVKRELLVGHLSSVRKAVLPVSAAAGGMLVPAAIYLAINLSGGIARGWGVPVATDIAFALGALAMFGKRVPVSLKVFLTATAIADDIGAVLVIALFYTETIRIAALLIALGLLVVLYFVASVLAVRRLGLLLLLIVGVWIAVFASGVHATVAGILVALVVPVRARIEPKEFFGVVDRRVGELRRSGLSAESMIFDHQQLDGLADLQVATERMQPAGLLLEHYWHPVQAFLILPLFALANAGVALDGSLFGTLASPVALGIIAGLVVGKQVGVTLASWLAVRSGYADLPRGVSWAQVHGASCLAGIGFTMSLFVSGLAFVDEATVGQAKIAILAASLASAGLGALFLGRALPQTARQPDRAEQEGAESAGPG